MLLVIAEITLIITVVLILISIHFINKRIDIVEKFSLDLWEKQTKLNDMVEEELERIKKSIL